MNFQKIIDVMDGVMKDANKMYDTVINLSDGVAGPTRAKTMLLNELEDSMTVFDTHLGDMRKTMRFKKVKGVEATVSTAQVRDFMLSHMSFMAHVVSHVVSFISYVSRISKWRTLPL